MFRSPPKLRSGSKGEPILLSGGTDKRKLERSLSVSSDPGCSTTTTMAPTGTDKAVKVDATVIADLVGKHLSSGDVFGQLVTRITQELRGVVEEAVRAALTSVSDEVGKLKEQVGILTQRLDELDDRLQGRCDDLEQYQRRQNLRIFGVEEKAGEDTDRIVLDLCRNKLGVDLPATAICRSHRVGGHPKPGPDGRKRHRPVIVRLVSYQDRRMIYNNKKKLKGTGITVREDLTSQRLEVLRRVTAQHGVNNTWTQDGRVLWLSSDGRKGVATRLADLQASK